MKDNICPVCGKPQLRSQVAFAKEALDGMKKTGVKRKDIVDYFTVGFIKANGMCPSCLNEKAKSEGVGRAYR